MGLTAFWHLNKLFFFFHVYLKIFKDMGNTSVKAETSSGHFQVGSQESFEIELNGVLWQCRVTYDCFTYFGC